MEFLPEALISAFGEAVRAERWRPEPEVDHRLT